MRSLCSVFDVKKQGKPIREARTRYWKLREGENRLSVLLEGISLGFLHIWPRVSVLAFEYRYWLPENGFWSSLKHDSLRLGP
ncbi:hypothetical protein GQ457_10G013950 [Hibiscus cannabinus]